MFFRSAKKGPHKSNTRTPQTGGRKTSISKDGAGKAALVRELPNLTDQYVGPKSLVWLCKNLNSSTRVVKKLTKNDPNLRWQSFRAIFSTY